MNIIFPKPNNKENVNIILNIFSFFLFIILVIFRIKIILHRRRQKKAQKFIIK